MPAKFTQIVEGVPVEQQQALMNTHKIDGLCCSFAMDWLKKRLAQKDVNEQTYSNAARLKKIGKRQKTQGGGWFSDGGPSAVAMTGPGRVDA